MSNGVSRITFSWNVPSNYISGWKFRVFILIDSTWLQIYEGTGLSFIYYPPSIYTLYTYKIHCYNGNNAPGPSVSITRKVTTTGGGGGPEYMNEQPIDRQSNLDNENLVSNSNLMIPLLSILSVILLPHLRKIFKKELNY